MVREIYDTQLPADRLRQGDILDSAKLKDTLKGHQDYFADNELFGRFVVMTQTCDLVPDRAADFICLAVVRKLEKVLDHRNIVNATARDRTKTLLKDLINYNYNKRGLFYLPPKLESGIERDSVIDIRVMFSLSRRHYQKLLNARIGALSQLFATKLGSMAGEMFARVAVDSWDECGYPITSKNKIKTLLEDCQENQGKELNSLMAERGNICEADLCNKEVESYCWRVHPTTFKREYKVLCLEHASEFDIASDDAWEQ